MIDRRLGTINPDFPHQLSNAVAEGLHSKIMAIKRRAEGYRTVGNVKDVIYFYHGRLKLDSCKTRKDRTRQRQCTLNFVYPI